jgi:hypothetical protein
MKRKRYTNLMLALALTSVLMTAVVVNAKPLQCTMDLIKDSSGPPPPAGGHNTWTGTVSGDIEGNIYFYKTDAKLVGQAKHFWEVWLITDAEDNMLLMGTDKGVVSLANLEYRMNGVVTDAAPEYAHLIGRNVYMGGEITTMGPPPLAIGIFRVQ